MAHQKKAPVAHRLGTTGLIHSRLSFAVNFMYFHCNPSVSKSEGWAIPSTRPQPFGKPGFLIHPEQNDHTEMISNPGHRNI